MKIYLYSVSDDDRTIPKHLNSEYEITGVLRSETDFYNPVFRVELQPTTLYNYAYIPDFGRYYYLSPPVSIRSGLLEYSGRCDVLQSFYNQFKNCPMIAARADSDYNTFVPDNMRKFYQYESHEYATIGNLPFEDDTTVLGNINFVVVTVG